VLEGDYGRVDGDERLNSRSELLLSKACGSRAESE